MTGGGFAGISTEDGQDDKQWLGEGRILGPRWAHLPTVTLTLLGVQIFWSIEMSYASPYLLSLGLSKSNMAMVFLAGPLSGLIVQPLIGVLADNSKSRFGRRRPFMIAGVLICILAMLLLGFTRPVASIFVSLGSKANDVLTIWLAVLSIYCIDFSINAVQAVDRALLVDLLPASEQASASAWAARMLGLGSVAGFFIGVVDLTKIFPFLGSTQLEVLAIVASVLMLAMHGLTAFSVKEKILLSSGESKGNHNKFVAELKELFINIFSLPRTIQQICLIQFFAWIGWFPVLFYTSVYVGDIYKRAFPVPVTPEATAALEAEANRVASRALFWSSVVALVANIVLPFFIAEAHKAKRGRMAFMNGGGALSTSRSFLEWIQVHLATMWALSHLIFALCMLATFFTSSVSGATFLVTATGLPWAITQWAPFSLLGEAILTEAPTNVEDTTAIRLLDTRHRSRAYPMGDERQFLVGEVDNEDEDDDAGRGEPEPRSASLERRPRRSLMSNSRAQIDISSGALLDGHVLDAERSGGLASKAGIILGIHNLFIVIPQFLVTGLSSIIFAIIEPSKSVLHGKHPGSTKPIHGNVTAIANAVNRTMPLLIKGREEVEVFPPDGPNSVAIIFRIGGVSALVAFVLCLRLARELRHR